MCFCLVRVQLVALSSCLLGYLLLMVVVRGYMLCVMRKCVDEKEMMRKGKEQEARGPSYMHTEEFN